MTANLLFSQLSHQTQPKEFEHDLTVGTVRNHPAVAKTVKGSTGIPCKSFRSTLEQIAKDNNTDIPALGPKKDEQSTYATDNSHNIIDAGSGLGAGLETGISETAKQLIENSDDEERPFFADSDLVTVADIFEKLGLYDSAGRSNFANKADGILGGTGVEGALRRLVDQLAPNDRKWSDAMEAFAGRLQYFHASAPTDSTSSRHDETHLSELADDRSIAKAVLFQLMEGTVPAQKDQRDPSDFHFAKGNFGEMPSDPLGPNNRVASSLPLDPKISESLKLSVEGPAGEAEANENLNEPRSSETDRPDAGGPKHGSDIPGEKGAINTVILPNRILVTNVGGEQISSETVQQNLPNNESVSKIKMNTVAQAVTDKYQGSPYFDDPIHENTKTNAASAVSKSTHDTQSPKAIIRLESYAGEIVQDNAENKQSAPASKMIHASQMAKENQMGMETTLSDQLGGKILKVDAGTNAHGLPNPLDQTAAKTFQAASQPKQTEMTQDSFRTQTLDQLVRKAVVVIKDGRHEAKIDLKPEYLGHVRMQVTTANHQVAIKILTEFGFVKDMVENSIHQLKADLQLQGLSVDKLEVAMSNGSKEYEHPQEKAGHAKNRRRRAARISAGIQEGEAREQLEDFDLNNDGTATVDYFA